MAAPRIQLVLSESNIDIANNRSTVTATLYYYGNGETHNANAPCSIEIGGYKETFTYAIRGNTNGIIGRMTRTFDHAADGTKTIGYKAVVNASERYGPTQTSGTYKLRTIPRATTPTLNPAKTMKYGQELTITLSPAVSTFKHKLYYTVGKGWQSLNSGNYVTSPFKWIPPKSLATHTTEYAGRTMSIKAETYDSTGKYVGEKESSIIIYPSDDMKPSVSITLSDPTGYKDKYGGFVRGQSKIKATLSETLSYGAAIKLREIVIDGIKYNNVTTATSTDPVTKLNEPVTARVTDKRDMVGTASVKPTYLDWYQPKLTLAKVQRCTAGGTINESGDHVRIDFAVDVAPLNNKNAKNLKIGIKQQGTQNYTDHAVTLDGYKYQGYKVLAASSNYAFDVCIELSDAFATGDNATALTRQIGTAFTLMNWRSTGKGMAIGKVSEQDAFEVALPMQLTSNLNGQYITGTWLQTTASTHLNNAASKFAVLDGNGWIYHRTAAEVLSDLSSGGLKDYVVEQGIKENWTYRKWDSGLAEAWKKTSASNLGTSGQENGWYYRFYNTPMPTGIFKTVTDAHCDCHWGTGNSFASARAVDITNFQAVYYSNQNGGVGEFYHQVKGTWK